MKRRRNLIIIITVGFIVLTGCSTIKKGIPTFKESNAYFLMENIEKIDLNDVTKNFNKNDNIIIVSMENEETYDNSLIAIVEDVLIEKLLKNGYKVLERDKDLIYRLMSESDEKYNFYNRNKRKAILNSGTFGISGSLYGYSIPYGISKSIVTSGKNMYEIENYDENVIKTNLTSADKMIAYRILECGIAYKEDEKSTKADSLDRIAHTIIKCRVEDANSGDILSITDLENITKEKISKKDKELLEEFHYRYYGFAYPNIYGNPHQLQYNKDGDDISKFNNKKTIFIVLGAIASIVVVSVIAGQ